MLNAESFSASILGTYTFGLSAWARPLWCFLLICCGAYLPAQAQSSVSRIDVPVSVVYARDDPPTWELKADYTKLEEFGLLREGDRVVVEVSGGYNALLGVWEETYRYEERDCTLFIFCSKKIIYQDCPIKYFAHPTEGSDVDILVTFLREGVKGTDEVAGQKTLGIDAIEYKPQGPQLIQISGGVTKTPDRCKSPPSEDRVSGPIQKPVEGGLPSPWFNVHVTVHHPQLEY